jgi:hypothetical protein
VKIARVAKSGTLIIGQVVQSPNWGVGQWHHGKNMGLFPLLLLCTVRPFWSSVVMVLAIIMVGTVQGRLGQGRYSSSDSGHGLVGDGTSNRRACQVGSCFLAFSLCFNQ